MEFPHYSRWLTPRIMFTIMFIFPLLLRTGNAIECETPPETKVMMKQYINGWGHPIVPDAKNFTDLITRSKLFIDNTKLLDEIIQRMTHPNYIMITGPDNWGKSMTIGMLKSFFELTFTETGQKIPRETTANFHFFLKGEITGENGTKEQFRSPPIIGTDWLHMRYQGVHPVIHITFKDAVGDNATVVKQKMYAAINRAFEPFKFLRAMPKWYDKRDSVQFLCESLSDHIGDLHMVVILIEDYDTPILNFLQNDQPPKEDMYEIIRFLKDLIPFTFRVVDDDQCCMFRGIITGRYSLEYHTFDEEFFILNKTGETVMEYFGFSHKDVEVLFKYSKIENPLKIQAYKWYGGYYSLYSNQSFYNPLAISRFLWRRRLGVYSKSEKDYTFVQKLFKKYPFLVDDVLSLINDQTVDILDKLPLSFEYKPQIRHVFDTEKLQPRPAYDRVKFFTYLVQDGVLVKIPGTLKAKLPNKEMTCMLARNLMCYYRAKNHILEETLLKTATLMGNFIGSPVTSTVRLEEQLNEFYNETRTAGNITDLHSIFNCLMLRAQDETQFDIDVYYNKIYKADYIAVHRETQLGIIIELRQNSTVEKAVQAAEEHKSVLEIFGEMSITKFVGINITPNHTVQILSKCYLRGGPYEPMSGKLN